MRCVVLRLPGMDPEGRRFMWDYIARVKEGRAIILTTHSMEEADALCDNIGPSRTHARTRTHAHQQRQPAIPP